MKKLVYEKVPGQANPADLFTKGVGREKLQQFAWASGQTFLDGRAEKSLQVQGVCVLQVGVGNSGILRVSSGLAGAANPVGDRWAPNALVLNKTQEQSKMSQSVHVEIKKIGQTGADRQRANRAIGEMPTSGISTYSQRNPRRNRQGGVVHSGDGFL